MRLFILLLLATSLAATPAPAQPFIHGDNAVAGELTAADSALEGGARYDTWRFSAKEWHGYVIFARADFDVHLSAGVQPGGRCGDDCVETTHAQHGTAIARLDFTPPEGDTYLIRVAAVRAGDRGRYELRLEEYADTVGTPVITVSEDAVLDVAVTTDTMTGYGSPTLPADTVQMPPVPLRAGASVTGVLDERDRRGALDPVYLDAYAYRARAGEAVVIRMDSDDFDTEVRVLRSQDGTWSTLGLDDDGGGGTNSELTITFPEAGAYEIHARAHSAGQTGRYTLSVARP